MAEEVQEPKVKEITFEELEADFLKKNDGKLILIDVRNADELKTQGAIPGAVNIPLPEVPDAFKNLDTTEFKDKYGFEKNPNETLLVFSCRSGKRAEAACCNLKGIIPIESMRLYRGSFMDWEAHEGPIKKINSV